MKLMIWLGIIVGGAIGGGIGALLDGGLGMWSILFSTLGSLAGVWASYKISKTYL